MDELREGMPGGGMGSLPRLGLVRTDDDDDGGVATLLAESFVSLTDDTVVSLDGDRTERIADGCDESVEETVPAGDDGIWEGACAGRREGSGTSGCHEAAAGAGASSKSPPDDGVSSSRTTVVPGG